MKWGPFGAAAHTAHITQNWLKIKLQQLRQKG